MRFAASLRPAMLLTGCVTNLTAVRDFSDETKKISVAFYPLMDQAVEHCKSNFLQHSFGNPPGLGVVLQDHPETADTPETC